ncbi:MAG: aminotransferase class I/II-fold pyridoxal phosphate-dependent enzyme [Bacteroidales bacterium]|jgi:threonine aldolase|nr:aminotransferase class I/II-fold pyridoxal phosphate-dependent enzyme [Bacteroidales bacterium]
MKGFASDNYSGVHPQILKALSDVNVDHATAYGGDVYTEKAIKQFKDLLGNSVEVYFTFIGTAANVLGLKALTQSYNAVICAETAHIHVDECGAPERLTGCQLLTVPTKDGKLRVSDLDKFQSLVGFEHHVQPKVISISQTTELGTLYSLDEIKALADYAHAHAMYLHVDGARIANAAAALNMPVKAFTFDCGVDVLSFGGTKNGMMYGEAIVFANASLCENFQYIRKQNMQLASKMRYISAQFSAYLTDDLYLQTARQANAMGQLLVKRLESILQIEITQKAAANAVFAKLPKAIIQPLQDEYFFYEWDEQNHEVRWMCSWDTTETEIENFVALIQNLLKTI